MIDDLSTQLAQTARELLTAIVDWTPRLLLGLVLIVMALLVAKVIERVLRSLLTRLRFDALIERVGIDQALHRIGLRQSLNVFLPRVVYFLLLFLFARTAADTLGLDATSSALGTFLAYLPNIVAAVLILLLGSAAAQFAGRTVESAGEESGIEFASSLGSLVSGLILFVVGIMAIGQLQIDTEMVRLVTTGLMAAIALAFGLSFGLGSRDVTRNLMAGFYARKTFEIGQRVEIGDAQGTLRSITATHALLEDDGDTVAISNETLMTRVVRQRGA